LDVADFYRVLDNRVRGLSRATKM